jgi:DNA-binding transcriptional ArsR family regulator
MVEYPDEQLDAVFAALAHPVRRSVLERVGPGKARVTELAAAFEISLAGVSKHIRVLEDAGLLRRVVHGREHHLTLVASPLLSADRWLDSYRRFWEPSLDRLEARLRGDAK